MAHVSPQTPRHAGFTGSTLVRLLAQLGGGGVQESAPPAPFAARLSQWLTWTDAIALSAALEAPPAGPRGVPMGADTARAEWDRARAALARSITERDNDRGAFAGAPTRGRPPAPSAAPAPDDDRGEFPPHRRRYLALQQSMQAAVGAQRGRLRAALADGTPGQARLAALDAVMEQVLAPREQYLLSTVPGLLERHFRRLRDAQAPGGPGQDTPWLDTFLRDMQAVQLAELELRAQPVEGLAAALAGSQPPSAAHHE